MIKTTKIASGRYRMTAGDLSYDIFKDHYTGYWRVRSTDIVGAPDFLDAPVKTKAEAASKVHDYLAEYA